MPRFHRLAGAVALALGCAGAALYTVDKETAANLVRIAQQVVIHRN